MLSRAQEFFSLNRIKRGYRKTLTHQVNKIRSSRPTSCKSCDKSILGTSTLMMFLRKLKCGTCLINSAIHFMDVKTSPIIDFFCFWWCLFLPRDFLMNFVPARGMKKQYCYWNLIVVKHSGSILYNNSSFNESFFQYYNFICKTKRIMISTHIFFRKKTMSLSLYIWLLWWVEPKRFCNVHPPFHGK